MERLRDDGALLPEVGEGEVGVIDNPGILEISGLAAAGVAFVYASNEVLAQQSVNPDNLLHLLSGAVVGGVGLTAVFYALFELVGKHKELGSVVEAVLDHKRKINLLVGSLFFGAYSVTELRDMIECCGNQDLLALLKYDFFGCLLALSALLAVYSTNELLESVSE